MRGRRLMCPKLAAHGRGRSCACALCSDTWTSPGPGITSSLKRSGLRLLSGGCRRQHGRGPGLGPVRAVPAPGPGPGRRRAASGGRGAGAAGARLPRADLDRALRPRALLLGDARPAGAERGGLAASQPLRAGPRALRRAAHGLRGALRAAAERGGDGRVRVRPGWPELL
ncbi:unnamed protein product, partial [Lepidochelys kempii]